MTFYLRLCSVALILLDAVGVLGSSEVCDFTNSTEKESLRLCEGGSGTLLPLFPTWEAQQSRGLRVVVYLIGLLWSFAGVALLADAFMGAIEVITSQEETKNDGINDYKVLVWNPTVANLTLMALGSSAPEIVLAIIEITANDMFTGELGPSTIVGSAAFNLLVIIGICVVSIPKPDDDPHGLGYRRVKQRTVLFITSFNSVFAYLWLLVILMGTSPDLIEPWEGIITFMFCPIMVLVAYLADKGYFNKDETELVDPANSATVLSSHDITEKDVFSKLKEFCRNQQMDVSEIDEETAADVLLTKEVGNLRQTRALHRRGVIESLLHPGRTTANYATIRRRITMLKTVQDAHKIAEDTVGFKSTLVLVKENVEGGICRIDVEHKTSKNPDIENLVFTVDYETQDGDAHAGRKYHAKKGTLRFTPDVTTQTIEIGIIDNEIEEADEVFMVNLTNLQVLSGNPGDVKISSSHDSCAITILDDDKKGFICLSKSKMTVSEDVGFASIVLLRKQGANGELKCIMKTVDGSAVSPSDYASLPEEGVEITFADGEIEKSVDIKIIDDQDYEKDERFTVSIEPAPGANKDTVALPNFMRVTIKSNDKIKKVIERATQILNFNRHRMALGRSVWAKQIWEAVKWPSKEDGKAAPVVHVILFPWKLLAALVPPTFWLKGRVAFVVALLYIAIVTALIGDLASMFGCAIGLSDAVTAITFVALGTSLPDTFASRTAAVQDSSADAAIGNVTGSNAVNVYLGLGLPWMIASIYWRLQGATCAWQQKYPGAINDYSNGGFYVPAGDLGFTVGVFCGCAAIAFCILLFRRASLGAELGSGGPMGPGSSLPTTLSGLSMCGLWIIFVVVSSLKTEGML